MNSKEHMQEALYYDYVHSMISYYQGHYWRASNRERGYISNCWRSGVKPEDLAQEIMFKSRAAELPLERNSDIRNPASWTECPHCGLIHDPKLTRCWITGSS